MAIEIVGNWKKGLAFDFHTLGSEYLGVDEYGRDRWDTERSEMGELVYRLKYHQEQNCIPQIINLLEKIKGIDTFDLIAPIPPTDQSRKQQPTAQIAEMLGRRHGVRVLPDLLARKGGGPELKNVNNLDERRKLLRESMSLSNGYDVSGLKVLLVDDVYRSGATLSAATDLLLSRGGANAVCALTMTKTRSTR